MQIAVRVRGPKERKWSWVGDNSTLTSRESEAFTYPPNYRFVAEEVAVRARQTGMIAELRELPGEWRERRRCAATGRATRP